MNGLLIYLHGYDDDPSSWPGAVDAMLPHGWTVMTPIGPVATATKRAWFETDEGTGADPTQVAAALDAVTTAIDDATGTGAVHREDIALAGFSQGAALALLWSLSRPADEPPIRAVIAIAGWLPDVEGIDAHAAAGPLAHRVLVAHGTDDETIPALLGRSVAKLLQRQGADVTLVEREVGHDPTPFAEDVRTFLS